MHALIIHSGTAVAIAFI